MICEKCGLEYEGEVCQACAEEITALEKNDTELPACDNCATAECEVCEAEAEETACEIIEAPQKKKCTVCGYEYDGDNCPACVFVAKRRLSEKKKRSKLGLAGMIVALAGIAADLLLPIGMATLPIGIASFILSVIGKAKCKKDGFATAGILLSILKILLNVFMFIGAVISVALYFFFIIFLIIIGIATSSVTISDVDRVF